MGFEAVTLIREVQIDCDAPSQATFRIYSDIPSNAIALRVTKTISVTTGRQSPSFMCPGSIRGRLWKWEITPTGLFRLYGMRVWARQLPGGRWGWYDIPVTDTPEEFTAIPLPIPTTPDEFAELRLPVTPSEEAASWTTIPVDE